MSFKAIVESVSIGRCVGIGRRGRLKICYPQGCVGSSPTTGTTIPTRNWYKSGREFFTPLRQKVPAAEDFSGNFAELYGLGDVYLNKKSGAEDWSRSLRRFILPHWRISRERVAISLNCVQIYRNVNIWIILRSIDWCSMHSEFFSHIEPRCGRIESPVSASSPSLPIARIRVLLCFLVLFLWFDSWLFPRSVLQSS